MRQSYELTPPSEATLALSRKLVNVLIDANIPFGEALDALDAAENILKAETRPIKV